MSYLDQNEEEDEQSQAPAAPDPSQAAAPAATSQVPAPLNPQVRQYLMQKYGLGADSTALAQAQQQAAHQRLVANLSAAGDTAAAAFTGAPEDHTFSNQLMQQANAPVDQVMQQRAAVDQANKQVQAQQSLDEGTQKLAAGDVQAKLTGEENDPNGAQAQALRKVYAPILEKAGIDPTILDKASAADIKQYMQSPLELQERMTSHAQDIAAQNAMRQTVAQGNQDVRRSQQAIQQQQLETKQDTTMDKSYTQLRKDLESFRGNKAASQAAMDTLSADKALQLVKGKDPNTLTTQDLNLLAGEMAKIATGGVPTEHGVQALMPSNLSTKVAEMQNFLSSSPTNANAAAYIQKNMKYLDEMRTIAQGTLDSYRGNILKGYKGRVRPDDYQEAQTDYGLGMPSGSSSGASPAPQAASADDQAALQWAQSNPKDPRAAQILKHLGGAQ